MTKKLDLTVAEYDFTKQLKDHFEDEIDKEDAAVAHLQMGYDYQDE